MLWRSRLLTIPWGPLLYNLQSKPNQSGGLNPIFSPPKYTKSVFSPKTRLVWFDRQFPKVNDTHAKLGTLSEPQCKSFYICHCSGPLCHISNKRKKNGRIRHVPCLGGFPFVSSRRLISHYFICLSVCLFGEKCSRAHNIHYSLRSVWSLFMGSLFLLTLLLTYRRSQKYFVLSIFLIEFK